MACQEFNLVRSSDSCYPITQGSTFNNVTFLYPSDVSTWSPRGQIRKNYADVDAAIEASFSFDALSYGSYTINGVTSNYTAIRPTLTATQTQGLEATKQGIVAVDGIYITITDANGNAKKSAVGTDLWVYDIELESGGGTVIKVARGLVQVLREVTRA